MMRSISSCGNPDMMVVAAQRALLVSIASGSVLWNRDVSSAGDPTKMSFALGSNSSTAYEIICDKGYIHWSGVRRLQVMFLR